jgi:hypothetical protein
MPSFSLLSIHSQINVDAKCTVYVIKKNYPCETLRLLHFLDNRLTDGGEVVSPTRRMLFTPQEDSWYSFL